MNNSGKSALGLDANVAALLAYLPICAVNLIMSIIIIATDKTNKLARFHAFQSLLLMGACIVLGVGLGILGGIVAVAQSTALALVLLLVQAVIGLAILAAIIMCMVKAFQGQMFKLPVIGDMADKWSN
ncbi:MAG: hypothetical protein IPL32_12750 [Chloracidobacterium sp.]|nr:hypothetical protein [Chloracidobacterium sp.]